MKMRRQKEKKMKDNNATVFVNEEKGMKKKTDELNQLYWELGKAYYEGGYEDPLPQLLPLFDKITMLKKQKSQGKICPMCITNNNEKALFCKNCRFRFSMQSEERCCPRCKRKVSEKDMYCVYCGEKIQ